MIARCLRDYTSAALSGAAFSVKKTGEKHTYSCLKKRTEKGIPNGGFHYVAMKAQKQVCIFG
jgi:hypothetical protein